VLEELSPIMERAIYLGERICWFGGRPLLAPTVVSLSIAFCAFVYSSVIQKRGVQPAAGRWVFIVAAGFCLLYFVGGSTSFAFYLFCIALVPALAFLGSHLSENERSDPVRTQRSEKILLACIILFGLVLRLYKLDVLPRVYSIDDQLFAQAALQVSGEGGPFLAEPSWVKAHMIKLLGIRFGFWLFVVGMFQQRTISALEGALCILLAYFLCRKIWGSTAGMFAALIVAVDPWHLGYSKFGNHFIEGPLLLLLLFSTTIKAARIGGRLNFALLGMMVGAVSYMYQSCYVMAPFSVAAVAAGRYWYARAPKRILAREMLWLAAAFSLAILPHLTIGSQNLIELLSEQTAPKNFLHSAEDYHFNPAFMLFVNFWNSLEHILRWSPRLEHPARMFYSSPTMVALSLIGLGMMIRARKRFEIVLILAWLPVAFLPITFGYGFADRRLFATLVPIPALLAALPLTALWETSYGSRIIGKALSRGLAVLLVITITLSSAFIVFKDSDPSFGNPIHPRKVPEFIASLPSDYTILISNQVKEFPFVLDMANYDQLNAKGNRRIFNFMEFEDLQQMMATIAPASAIAVVTNPGREEERFMKEIRRLNPAAKIIRNERFLACLIDENVHAEPHVERKEKAIRN